jgi:hypothetical protein
MMEFLLLSAQVVLTTQGNQKRRSGVNECSEYIEWLGEYCGVRVGFVFRRLDRDLSGRGRNGGLD